jgi:hypothetical protein
MMDTHSHKGHDVQDPRGGEVVQLQVIVLQQPRNLSLSLSLSLSRHKEGNEDTTGVRARGCRSAQGRPYALIAPHCHTTTN